jgi:hypothetical protein
LELRGTPGDGVVIRASRRAGRKKSATRRRVVQFVKK